MGAGSNVRTVSIRCSGISVKKNVTVIFESIRCMSRVYRKFFCQETIQPIIMHSAYQSPALVIVILWGIAIFTTTFLFRDSPNLTYGIVIQGVCMIGSAAYLNKRAKSECKSA